MDGTAVPVWMSGRTGVDEAAVPVWMGGRTDEPGSAIGLGPLSVVVDS